MHGRILMTTDVLGGVWDFSVILAGALRSEWQVILLAFGEPSGEQREAASQVGAELYSAPFKLEWMQDSLRDVSRSQQLVAELVRDVGADIVHTNLFAAACAPVDVPVVLTLHSDVLSWSRWTVGAHASTAEWSVYVDLVERAVQKADAVVAVSKFLASEVGSLYRVARPVDVIYNAWPLPNITAAIARERITLVAGRIWDPAKNVTLVAEATQGWDPGRVCLAGAQAHPETGALPNIAECFEPLGFLPRVELDDWLRRADVYVSPARYDPFGLLPLQAALNGCALLLSDIPSYRELWDGAACFFHSGDASDLRRQWSLLLDDPELRSTIQLRAAELARRCYTPARMADAYQALYASVSRRAAA
jgi:glycogen(starch) synthase